MSDFTEYDRRISFALERIGRSLESLGRAQQGAGADPVGAAPDSRAQAAAIVPDSRAQAAATAPDSRADADHAALRDRLAEAEAALGQERETNARLIDRVRALKDKQEGAIATLERRVARLSQLLEAGGTEAGRLRRANEALRAALVTLQEAMVAGLSDPAAIDQALAAETEALRAARASELSEMEAILAELGPLLAQEPPHA